MTAPVQSKPRIRITADGWIKHDGKGMPVPGRTLVDVRHADGLTTESVEAAFPSSVFDWWAGQALDPADNIVAFRIIDIGEAA